ncbi:MAG: VOC family protein [Lysobacteraceae bacterium]
MGITKSHPVGAPNWFELATTDQQGAKAFYEALFGWHASDKPISDGEHYTIFEYEGAEVAACYSMMPDQIEMGVPPHWGIYFRVEDCDASAARAVELGGKLLAEPFDVMQHLRMAVIAAPDGAAFMLAQPREHPGVGRIREDNAVTWVELATRDLAGSESFYSQMFDWTIDEHQNAPVAYRLIGDKTSECGNFGGLLKMSEEWGQVPPHWSIYVQVQDVDATLAKAVELGGRINVPGFDAPGVGRIGQFADPAGAWVYVIKLEPA